MLYRELTAATRLWALRPGSWQNTPHLFLPQPTPHFASSPVLCHHALLRRGGWLKECLVLTFMALSLSLVILSFSKIFPVIHPAFPSFV